MLITSLGLAVGGFLLYGLFGFGWNLRGKSRTRRWAAIGAGLAGGAAGSLLANGLFWADDAQISGGVANLLVLPPALGGLGALLGWLADRHAGGSAAPIPQEFVGPQPPQSSPAVGKQSRAPATEEDPFDIAGRELHTGEKHVGTWARAMVEADGDSGRTEAAYVRLRVASLKAAAQVQAALDAERAPLEADAESKAKENNVSRFEAKLTILAHNAIAKRGQNSSEKIHEVWQLAAHLRENYERAEILARWEIYGSRSGYKFQGKDYSRLTDAISAAQAQSDEKASTLGTVRAPSGPAAQGGAAPAASDDQPPFRWEDFR